MDEAGDGGIVGWESVLGKGGNAERVDARVAGLRSDWNCSEDGEMVERNTSELLWREFKSYVTYCILVNSLRDCPSQS